MEDVGTPNLRAEHQVEVIGIGRRALAYLIDVILLGIIGSCAGFAIGAASGALIGTGEDATGVATITAFCAGFVIDGVYFVVLWATTGQTLGKMALGIKVIGTDGAEIRWAQAIIRYIGYWISGLILTIGFAWIAFDEKRQGWHDKMANTLVVRKGTEFSAAPRPTFVSTETISSRVLVFLYYGVLCFFPIGVIALLTLLGPQIGDVFSSITSGLE